jgi:cytochrome c
MTRYFSAAGWGACALVAALLLASSTTALALDGKSLYVQKTCPTCHGPDGNKPIAPNYPKLKGQNAEYLVAQLAAFKAGQRTDPMSALMTPMSKTVSDAEAEAIARWLATGK